MSGLNEQNARVQLKYTTLSGDTPTIAPSTDHTDGNWNATDIYVGEVMINASTDAMWFRSLNGIIPITSGTTYIDNTAYVNKSGSTMTGGLITPSLSATSISATTIISNGFNGIFVGDGSGLTGITSTTFTGGTISGPTTFTSTVDLCGAGVTVDTLSGCGGTLSILSDLEASGAISATTFYGSAAGLTDMPSLSGITLDEVLTQGDTSTDGNIQLTNGNITLDNGVFYGDGSGLTNIPSSPIPTLDDVLTTGNVSADNDILLTNGDIILGSGIFYGDGSGLTNLVATNDVFVTGGTYDNSTGTATFTNNTGDTFTVTGFTTGDTSSQTLEETLALGNTTGYHNILVPNSYGIFNSNGTIGSAGLTFDSDGTYLVASTGATYDVGSRTIMGATKVGDASIQVENNIDINMNLNGLGAGNFTVFGYSGFKGIEYSSDYSANFTNRSLVDKEYVDNAISGFSTGYTYISENTLDGILAFNSPNFITSDSLYIRNRVSGETYNNGIFTNTSKNSLYAISDVGDNHYLTKLEITDTNGITNYSRYIDDATSNQYIASEELTQTEKNTRIFTNIDDTETLYTQQASYIQTLATDGTDTSLITIQPNNIWIEGTGTFQGAKYDSDYSANFVNRSLVDKEYVDNAISGFSTGYTYINENTLDSTLTFSGANSIKTNIVNGAKTQTLTVDLDEIRLRADDTDINQTAILHLDRGIIENNLTKLEDGIYYFGSESLNANNKNITIANDTDYAQASHTLSQNQLLVQIQDGSASNLSEVNINPSISYIQHSAGEGRNNIIDVQYDYAELNQNQGGSTTRIQVSNQNGIYQSQVVSTGIGKGVSKTLFRTLETTDDTPTTVVWPLSDLEVGTTTVGIKATVTGINSTEDKAYISELYAAVRMNGYAVTIFGGVDKLEKTEYTTATSTIDIDSSNAAIIVTGEVGETIKWSVKYELIYAVL
jgi:hypothetical protein